MHVSICHMPATFPAKKQVRAVFDFDGESSEELSFRVGDIITVLEEIDEGWWNGEVTVANGSRRNGIFPVNYTEEISAPAPPSIPSRPTTAPRSYTSPAPTYNSGYADEPEVDDEY